MYFDIKDTRIDVNIADPARLEQAVMGHFQTRRGFALATVNLDHLVKMRSSPAFLKAYAAQDFVVADGRPIVWLSQLAQRPVALMPGSDMVVPLCRWAARAGVPIALVGSTDVALQDASHALQAEVPGLEVAWCHAPSGVFDPNSQEAEKILSELARQQIGLCFLALGAPKQEIMAARGRALAPEVGFASVGAGLDFLGGHQKRAPAWVRGLALEWLWRALSSPRRLGPRYLRCIAILPGQLLHALRLRHP
ncbi:WecB/TagA/CpsF family glycosyltransferase [Phaeobacter inhibens]|uniref:WecB/TagA/CpsF family glycosyltransferase n=1 Tax=Phaeobacter inhibens TaxID=221822 RepID=UPI0021A4CC56|nr:WecB/TagA/CpsF family glycosyltransferase [Phaeobacter inhibens]UWR65148.1 WecB/TagA/CpsF family glycosyltransferase [Phaeobacter inhibens]UWR73007.1 WecB/TagA/CpsF family glycosyltransferase [Phaeobacter inhibens]UWR96681.1 WecB/TagA/CpsF family glycosyltransferase [Phaeobacter inhibens]UWS04616.1 WecB/TagA/CpsF family glycosyltransferase [Phaeobacter inhibens]UWS08586.1 WecB/TagA/CpsF family glycosyltransferase [Phaeobacter inhibens]